jgi:hypothetical protein
MITILVVHFRIIKVPRSSEVCTPALQLVKKTAKKNLESILFFPFLYEFEPIKGLKHRNVYKAKRHKHNMDETVGTATPDHS